MEYLVTSSDIFGRQRRRRRIRALVVALGTLTAFCAAVMAARASQNDAFSRLVSPPGLTESQINREGRGTYAIVGGNVRFVFERRGREGSIRFLCAPTSPSCPDTARVNQILVADPASRGDTVFKTKDGLQVLRVTPTGGATLFGGAKFVPTNVPASGVAVVPAN